MTVGTLQEDASFSIAPFISYCDSGVISAFLKFHHNCDAYDTWAYRNTKVHYLLHLNIVKKAHSLVLK